MGKSKSLKLLYINIILIFLVLIIFSNIGQKSYYAVSFIVCILAMVPFFTLFEKRKPRASEIVPIAIMSAIAVVGRFAFAMLPQFKPVAAIVIITGMALGAEAGFLTGAISALVSNFFFGQGPWTPWQMLAFGLIGALASTLYKMKIIKSKISICIFGVISGYIYGLIVNIWCVLTYVNPLNIEGVIATYVMSFWFDTIHAVSTGIFLYILAIPMKEKLERIKIKYGLFR